MTNLEVSRNKTRGLQAAKFQVQKGETMGITNDVGVIVTVAVASVLAQLTK